MSCHYNYEQSLLAIHGVPLAGFGLEIETVSNKAMHRVCSSHLERRLGQSDQSGWEVTFSGVGEPSRGLYPTFSGMGVVEAVASIGYQNDKRKNVYSLVSVERYLLEGLHSYLDFYAKGYPGPITAL